jgi:hypothetical protein
MVGEICRAFLLKADFGVSERLTICTYDISLDGGKSAQESVAEKANAIARKRPILNR